jgi:hypothetical protein
MVVILPPGLVERINSRMLDSALPGTRKRAAVFKQLTEKNPDFFLDAPSVHKDGVVSRQYTGEGSGRELVPHADSILAHPTTARAQRLDAAIDTFFTIVSSKPGDSVADAWKKSRIKLHPDHGGNADAFAKALAAYNVIQTAHHANKRRAVAPAIALQAAKSYWKTKTLVTDIPARKKAQRKTVLKDWQEQLEGRAAPVVVKVNKVWTLVYTSSPFHPLHYYHVYTKNDAITALVYLTTYGNRDARDALDTVLSAKRADVIEKVAYEHLYAIMDKLPGPKEKSELKDITIQVLQWFDDYDKGKKRKRSNQYIEDAQDASGAKYIDIRNRLSRQSDEVLRKWTKKHVADGSTGLQRVVDEGSVKNMSREDMIDILVDVAADRQAKKKRKKAQRLSR